MPGGVIAQRSLITHDPSAAPLSLACTWRDHWIAWVLAGRSLFGEFEALRDWTIDYHWTTVDHDVPSGE